jgi:NhaP-type Na+/H+ or K+/H+ antiporter
VLSSFAINSYKRRYSHAPWIHESSIAALLGVLVGGLLKLLDGAAVRFDSNLFFYLVLPPVIFSAGYTLKRRKFFRYFQTIVVVLGTGFGYYYIFFLVEIVSPICNSLPGHQVAAFLSKQLDHEYD